MTPLDLEAQLARLQTMGIDALRAVWRERYGTRPTVRSPDVLRRLLADRLQTELWGRDIELERDLERLARTYARGGAVSRAAPRFRPGSVLVREHAGEMHRVEVLDDGFRWNDQRWRTLSQIAREITGVRWNGPRFFGLREAA
ncbi:hypothetical protein ASG17_12860 [Brevundimonas sp. Leaf363]|uniref:DUF2924 domain-containing protein n=1 Tax=Brevundimonas sp. Leaf363 TaxID=1736353 RepID=UPI0006F357E6|nr:DUF2924 domain-containing protein [Brevundimonas sp. Leaf363]KQS53850.1 hypothetical protein ASG17_12860 [Brevundimonas sp. Leaf363]